MNYFCNITLLISFHFVFSLALQSAFCAEDDDIESFSAIILLWYHADMISPGVLQNISLSMEVQNSMTITILLGEKAIATLHHSSHTVITYMELTRFRFFAFQYIIYIHMHIYVCMFVL